MTQTKPYGADATKDLCKFFAVAKINPEAKEALEKEIRERRPIFDCMRGGNSPVLYLNKTLAAYL